MQEAAGQNTGVESIFSVFGSVFDGAQSLLGDYFEFSLLKTELEAQKSGTSTVGNGTTSSAATVAKTSTNSWLKYVAFGLLGIAGLSLFVGKK